MRFSDGIKSCYPCQVLTVVVDGLTGQFAPKTTKASHRKIAMSSLCASCLTATSCLILPVLAMIGGNSVLKRFTVVRKLGAGSFGNVYELDETDNETADRIACKEIPKTADGITDFKHVRDQFSSFCPPRQQWTRTEPFLGVVQEVDMLKLLGLYRNINQMRYWSQTKDSCYILLEMCHGGTLQDYVLKLGGLTETQAASYVAKLLETTSFMHSKGMAHCV